jgi:hypothetical protein
MTKNQLTLTKKAQIAQRRDELSRLIVMGHRRHADLAELLNVSEKTIQRDLEELHRMLSKQTADRMVELQDRERMVSFLRLEALIKDLKPMRENKRTRIQASRLIKEIEERRSKLLGLDMASKHASTDPTGQHEYGRIPDEFKLRMLGERKETERLEREKEALTTGAPVAE